MGGPSFCQRGEWVTILNLSLFSHRNIHRRIVNSNKLNPFDRELQKLESAPRFCLTNMRAALRGVSSLYFKGGKQMTQGDLTRGGGKEAAEQAGRSPTPFPCLSCLSPTLDKESEL